MKGIKPILGITLLAQSVTFFVLFLVNAEKKKNLSRAFAAISAIGAIAGGTLLVLDYQERKKLKEAEEDMFDEFDEFLEDYDDVDVCEDDILCSFENTEA